MRCPWLFVLSSRSEGTWVNGVLERRLRRKNSHLPRPESRPNRGTVESRFPGIQFPMRCITTSIS